MRIKWIKGYLAGLLTSLLVCGLLVTAGAKSGKVMQELTYRDIRVSLDGEVLDLRDAIGEKVEPFMFDGTNYLPVRALAEALGLNVAWNGAEVMVVLTTPEPPQEETPEVVNATPKPEMTQVENLPAESVPVEEPTPESVKTAESSNKMVVNDCNVEIKTARLLRKYDDDLVIVATIQWTNGKSYAISAAGVLEVNATQNGKGLENAYNLDGYDSNGFFAQAQPGETLEFERAFTLKDTNSSVAIAVFDDDEPTTNQAKMTFTPSNMKQPASVKKTDTSTPTVTNDRTVYVTKTGKHYHYSGSCNGGNYYRSTLSEAWARGLTPCDKCVLTGN